MSEDNAGWGEPTGSHAAAGGTAGNLAGEGEAGQWGQTGGAYGAESSAAGGDAPGWGQTGGAYGAGDSAAGGDAPEWGEASGAYGAESSAAGSDAADNSAASSNASEWREDSVGDAVGGSAQGWDETNASDTAGEWGEDVAGGGGAQPVEAHAGGAGEWGEDDSEEVEGPEADQLTGTGHPAVDAAVRAVANAASLPVAEQLAAYEGAHETLREVLASIED